MLWGVVELEAAQNSPGFRGRKCLLEGAGRVGRQVILHDPDARGIRIMDIDEFAHAAGVVSCRAPLGDLDLAPRPMHVDAHLARPDQIAPGIALRAIPGPPRKGAPG